jgi:hypothetical protein
MIRYKIRVWSYLLLLLYPSCYYSFQPFHQTIILHSPLNVCTLIKRRRELFCKKRLFFISRKYNAYSISLKKLSPVRHLRLWRGCFIKLLRSTKTLGVGTRREWLLCFLFFILLLRSTMTLRSGTQGKWLHFIEYFMTRLRFKRNSRAPTPSPVHRIRACSSRYGSPTTSRGPCIP